ncbi:CDP-alcohol phosphatidyltransferase family protein [Acinetobacter gyllenbergii]|uniref:CDP-diacylglycerol-glycerol-3-phosphate 3-phosphatidyltransferase n=1 Tax=Acinetobacter gyllenbergii CIP 110306 = MTCC 11365 TaxID=1217657 RepID=A0A829HLI9_9GAMM|nr:CDP-alcohol phosphatidyltransferase family protein [Acinetobacter gyllenbergii]EPF88077.1 CDP-diacylglycerol-glycerol-3-phosphate 3-phosphatidyltransferase [Acinetobacter gyllenbergii CIP 110306 = MTCC 11365]EPH35847.1 CDP-diacylglycerol--glycerol-3-phosphate 3-phosphatidyltransferase [Acinetobacter gyllenbergii CIP 110306 = MTCC 11365]
MPSIYQLKPAFQNLLRPFVQWLYSKKITANQVTLLAMFISVGLAVVLYCLHLYQQPIILFLLFPVWMLVRMGFNAIDGMLAREFNQQSKLGAYLNEICDVISDSALYLCFLGLAFINPFLLGLVVFLAILSEYAGVMAPLIGQERRYDGPMGKSDRAFWFSLIAVFVSFSPYLIENNYINSIVYICNGLLIFIAALLILTIYNRIKNSIQL